MTDRLHVRSGSAYEDKIGFCRAIRIGDRVVVSGTAPIRPDGTVDPDPYDQAMRCFEIIASALEQAGATVHDVVRTRMYLTDASYTDAVSRAHSETFDKVRPTATMVVVAGLIDDRWKVEIEAEAALR